MEIPLINMDLVYHVGSMDSTNKRSGSHEGNGLSISLHPEEWKIIGKGHIGGDIWTLTKDNTSFLDALSLNRKHQLYLNKVGVDEGYLEPKTCYKLIYKDEESNTNNYMVFDSLEEATEENEEFDSDGIIKKIKSFIPSDKFITRLGWKPEILLMKDIFLTFYAEDHLKVDGVWWNENLDILNYSAPRGVILNSKLETWDKKITSSYKLRSDYS